LSWNITATARKTLTDPTGSMNEDFVESPIVGQEFIFVSEMPFPENPGPVSG
jgi:hypothetical protein